MFMKFHEGIITSDILKVHETIHKLWAKGKIRDPTTKPLGPDGKTPGNFHGLHGSSARRKFRGYFYEVKILESFSVNEAAQGDRDGWLEKTSGTTLGKNGKTAENDLASRRTHSWVRKLRTILHNIRLWSYLRKSVVNLVQRNNDSWFVSVRLVSRSVRRSSRNST